MRTVINLFTAWLVIVFLALSVHAENPDGSITLTPSTLYEMNRRTAKGLATLDSELAIELNTMKIKATQQEKRILELERITHGMQKQITILHAKKADRVLK